MWLLFNDLILGFAFGSLFREGYPVIAGFISANFEVCILLSHYVTRTQGAAAETASRIYSRSSHLAGCLACRSEA